MGSVDEHGTIIMDTPEEIEHYRMLALISLLRLEIKLGMSMHRGRSLIKVTKERYHITGTTKKAVLKTLEEKYEVTYGRFPMPKTRIEET